MNIELAIAVTVEHPEPADVVRLAYINGMSDTLHITTPTGTYRIRIDKLANEDTK